MTPATAALALPDPFAEATRLLASGDYDGAADWFGAALKANPRDAGALCGMGELCEIAGEFERAVPLYRMAARADARAVRPWLKVAELFERARNLPEALQAYEQARLRAPNDVAVLRGLGNALRMADRCAEAEVALRQAAALDPSDPHTALYLGAVHLGAGRFDDALALFERVRAIAPQLPDPSYFAALCLQSLHRHDDAVAVLRGLVAAHPPRKEWQNALGANCYVVGDWQGAIDAHRVALGLDPADVDTAVRIAAAYAMLPDYAKALRIVDEVLERAPADRQALRLKVQLLQCFERKDEALNICERLLAVDPDDDFAQAQRVSIRQRGCFWDGYDAFIADVSAYIQRATAAQRPMQLTIQDLHNLPLTWEHEVAAARQTAAGVEAIAALMRARLNLRFDARLARARAGERRKLRIGYTLPYTKEESFTILHEAAVAHHDHDRFEVYAYCGQPSVGTAFDATYRGHFDFVRDVSMVAPERAAAAVAADEIDILLDPTGHSGENLQALVALRPAPVTAQMFGYSITSGARYVDYLITDPEFMPPALGALCTETLVYLPDSLLPGYRPTVADRVFTRAELNLPEHAFVFCEFNQPFKFEPSIFSAWMRILARVPDSVLWLGSWTTTARRNICREAEARGISADRLVFSDVAKRDEHLARLRLADLVLDTRFHSGGATTLDALWVGVPLVTLADRTPASRNGASFSKALGMPEMVTYSLQDYEDLAVRVATDRALHLAWYTKVDRNRLTAPLFDAPRFTRHFERALEAMWEQTVAGRRARIDVAAEDAR